jgi:hypothetical protein
MQKQIAKQNGIVLIIFAIILVLAAMAYFIKMFDPAALQAARDDKNAQFLAQAKQALISHSVSRAAAGERPGDMPKPDYFASTEVPFDYDGTADTGCLDFTSATGLPLILSGNNVRCLGRLPWRTIGLPIADSSLNDPAGNMPWYAVSANLVDPGCVKLLNPNIVNLPYTGFVCNNDTRLSYPWLTVRDSSGNILSNQVAVVLMLPSGILPGQIRPVAPLGSVTNYLDSVTVPAVCVAPCVPGTYSNADFDNDFIIPPPVDAPASTSNDRVVYITIQELMRAVERRATQEAAVQLKRYYTNSSAAAANRFYPYAANLGDVDNACVDTNKAGFIPILPAYANCASAALCTTGFPITTVTFSLTSGSAFTSNTGSCSRVAGACRCTGAGNCRRGAIRFTCTAAGSCQSTGAGSGGTFHFTYTPKIPDVTGVTGVCAGSAGVVDCVGGVGTFSSPFTNCAHVNPGISTLPAWFTDNHWQDYIYYAISNKCTFATPGCVAANLTVGAHSNVQAVVISSGVTLSATEARPAVAQVRPSNNIADYLDSIENTNGDTIFDATSKMKANDYNDQPLIVAP